MDFAPLSSILAQLSHKILSPVARQGQRREFTTLPFLNMSFRPQPEGPFEELKRDAGMVFSRNS